MNKRTILQLVPLLLSANVYAQNGINNVEKLCGCFSVNFKYAETFSPINSYKYHEREDMNAMELVLPVEKTDKKIVMQHLLLINDTMVIKHWREEWAYESPVLYEYTGNKVWKKKLLASADVKNKWTQTIWEVNDEPRYQGISSWINNDGKTYWESTAYAPLPRREYTTRSDYNILKRRNRIMITDEGYMHEQDNEKLIRGEDNTDKLLAQEKGYNTYYRGDEDNCTAAREWWKKNEAFWTVVRTEWQQKLTDAETITVKPNADNKRLDEHFTALYKEWKAKKLDEEALHTRVKEVLTKFL